MFKNLIMFNCSMKSEIISKKIIVRGVVQGVGFRWFIEDIAKAEGVCGYVKNNPDGSVEIVAETQSLEVFERFITRIKTEHKYAVVREVDIRDIPPVYYKNFKISF